MLNATGLLPADVIQIVSPEYIKWDDIYLLCHSTGFGNAAAQMELVVIGLGRCVHDM